MTVAPTPRVGGRLLLVAPDDRLLLIHERIQDGSTHWLTPGGGVEAGESPQAAAAREAVEEVGIEVSIDSEAVLVTQRHWSWDGVVYDQTDHFFLVRLPAVFEPAPAGLTAMEQVTLLGYGWWSAAELAVTQETVVPRDLGAVLAHLLAEGR
ncbi:NUDIX domain-containing protein [Jatrophihabitans sp.]|uniref:NUDIX domain-containing protein n=1 Tax=Jatrophihabitans sp. TaxID=1932789 RepID=UPI0030C6E1D4|nr:MutT/nudix-family hydrolase [Jatrophihabitans sp.]